jgi:hypothetical protein
MAKQLKLRQSSDSKSVLIKRRMRNPRKASSSAMGTVMTAIGGADARAEANPWSECEPRSSDIQRMKTTTPLIGANQLTRQFRLL